MALQASGEGSRARLRRMLAAVGPVPASIHEMEGEALARTSSMTVVLLSTGERGVPLASRGELCEIFRKRCLSPVWAESLEDIPEDADIIVSTGSPVTREMLERVPKLRLVAVALTGVDHVDLGACRERCVTVVNIPDYSTDATCELVLGLILSHLRSLGRCHAVVDEGGWQCPPRQEDLASKIVGVIGTGRIGVRLSEIFRVFRPRAILGYSPERDPEFERYGGEYAETIAELFRDADIIVVACPLNASTEGLVSEDLLHSLRPGCLLVNVARGDVVDQAALASMLREGRFSAALDVFSEEPLPPGDPLRSVPTDRLLMTPHVGYQSQASLRKRLDATVKNILAFIAGAATNVV